VNVVLSPQKVVTVYESCLFAEGEDTSDHVPAEGIMSTVGFHPGRLNAHAAEIAAMLLDLPDDFQADRGGGMSFLNACMDRHGRQWTGDHRTMDMLLQLGMAAGMARCLMPRDMWDVLPGGMPYYAVGHEARVGGVAVPWCDPPKD